MGKATSNVLVAHACETLCSALIPAIKLLSSSGEEIESMKVKPHTLETIRNVKNSSNVVTNNVQSVLVFVKHGHADF